MKRNKKVLALCIGLFVLTGCAEKEATETANPSTPGDVISSGESERYSILDDGSCYVETKNGYSILTDEYEDETEQVYIIDPDNTIIASIYAEATHVEGDERSAVQRYAESVSNEVMSNAETPYTILSNQEGEFVYQHSHDGMTDIYAILDTGTETTLILAFNGYENYECGRENIAIRAGESEIVLVDIQSVLGTETGGE